MLKICAFAFSLLYVGSCLQKKPSTHLQEEYESRIKIEITNPFVSYNPDSKESWKSILDSIIDRDQRYRSLEKPDLFKQHLVEQKILDTINEIKIVQFLEKYGYPGPDEFGYNAPRAINLVIQHSNLQMQKKYYYYLETAYVKGQIPGESLALLEDRINASSNKFQYYGTQIIRFNGKHYLYPLKNVDSVNVYRKKIGLPDLKEYLSTYFQIPWDPDVYKGELPFLIKELKVTDSFSLHHNSE